MSKESSYYKYKQNHKNNNYGQFMRFGSTDFATKEEKGFSVQSSAIKEIKLHRNDIISGITSIDTFVNLITFLDNLNVRFYYDKTFKKSKDIKIPLEFNYYAIIKPLREKLVVTYFNKGTERKEVIEKEIRKTTKIRKINDNNYSFDFNGVNYRLSYELNYWRLYRNEKETFFQRKTLCSALEHLKIKYNATR